MPWIESVPNWGIRKTSSWHRPPIAFWSEANGDLPRRGLVGRSPGSGGIGSGVQAAGCHSAGGRLEPQPDLYRRVRAADRQPSLGGCARERPAFGPPYRTAEGFRGERLSSVDPGQGPPHGASRQASTRQGGIASQRNRYSARKIVLTVRTAPDMLGWRVYGTSSAFQ